LKGKIGVFYADQTKIKELAPSQIVFCNKEDSVELEIKQKLMKGISRIIQDASTKN
jgi:hypothetical protein